MKKGLTCKKSVINHAKGHLSLMGQFFSWFSEGGRNRQISMTCPGLKTQGSIYEAACNIILNCMYLITNLLKTLHPKEIIEFFLIFSSFWAKNLKR